MMVLLTCTQQKHTDITDDDDNIIGDSLEAVEFNLDHIKQHPLIVCSL